MIEATNHILELSGRLCELEKSLEELRTRESKPLREMEELKHRFRESRHKNSQLKGTLAVSQIEYCIAVIDRYWFFYNRYRLFVRLCTR